MAFELADVKVGRPTRKRLPLRRGVVNSGLGRMLTAFVPWEVVSRPYGLDGAVAGAGGCIFFRVSSSSLPVTFSLLWVWYFLIALDRSLFH